MVLEPSPLELDGFVLVIKEHAVRENEADTPSCPLMFGRLPNECQGELAVCHRKVMLVTPLLSRLKRSFDACPRRITDDEMELLRPLHFFLEEISTQDCPATRLRRSLPRCEDQAREHLAFSLQLLDVRRRELVEEGEVKTEGCDATCGWIQVKAKEILLENRHEGSGKSIILGVRVLTFPFFRQPVEQAHEEYPRTAGWVEEALIQQRTNPFQGNVEDHFCQESRSVECPGLPFAVGIFCLQKMFVDRTDGLNRDNTEVVWPERSLAGFDIDAVQKVGKDIQMFVSDLLAFVIQINVEEVAVEIFPQL